MSATPRRLAHRRRSSHEHPYRLSRAEVSQLLQELWEVRVSLGVVVRQEQAQSVALAPVPEQARAAGQQTTMVNLDETGSWQTKKRT
jgi:hypothetical protein